MLAPSTMQWLSQQGGLLTHVHIEDNGRAEAFKMVPCSHWHNGNKFPHEVEKDLRNNAFQTIKNEGLEYYLVPDNTTNAVGTVTQYVVPEEPQEKPKVTAPPAVKKYLKREVRKKKEVADTSK